MKLGEARTTHACGACGARLLTARWRDTGTIVHVEKMDARAGNFGGDIEIIPDLPGIADGQPPHVVRTTLRRTNLREHHCPKAARPFSATGNRKKVRWAT